MSCGITSLLGYKQSQRIVGMSFDGPTPIISEEDEDHKRLIDLVWWQRIMFDNLLFWEIWTIVTIEEDDPLKAYHDIVHCESIHL